MLNQMRFLKVLAGDSSSLGWQMAMMVASDECPSAGQVWTVESLQTFVASLAPGDWRDGAHIAAELYPWAEAGYLTPERCFHTPEEWPWLVLRAQGDWAGAVESAKTTLPWPECTGEGLDSFLCQITGRTDGDAQQAAKDVYRWALFGTLTREQALTALELLPQAVTEHDDSRGSSSHNTQTQNSNTPLDGQGSLSTETAEEKQDRRRHGDRILKSARKQAADRAMQSLRPSSSGPKQENTAAQHIRADSRSASDRPEEFSEVDRSGHSEDKALDRLRSQARDIRAQNNAVYQAYKQESPGSRKPIRFVVYGGETADPVLCLDRTSVEPKPRVTRTYSGCLSVHEQAGGATDKARRFFAAKGKNRFSSGTIAGVMTVSEIRGELDLPQLERLLRKSGITYKTLALAPNGNSQARK